jgi:hypothetical protein
MTAFLMVWKETGWPYENIVRLVHAFEQNGTVTEPWRIMAHTLSKPGDRVWALKQGAVPKVIFGVGRIVGEPALGDAGDGTIKMMVDVRFESLVDPTKHHLIDEQALRTVLGPNQVGARASGYPIEDEQSEQLEKLLLRQRPVSNSANGAWTDAELRATVADYFSMLKAELAGESYSKKEHRDRLRGSVSRSEGSIEFKHQNISAVLQEVGLPWIKGYKPRGNYQEALFPVIEDQLVEDIGELDSSANELPREVDLTGIFVAPPPPQAPAERRRADQFVSKFDVAARDAANRNLGREGERFVVAVEQKRLSAAGRPDLAQKVQWMSDSVGDGLGYDIHSFEPSGCSLFIEVKTTRGPMTAPFYVTENERRVATEKGGDFRLYRVFDFGEAPKIYFLQGALEKSLALAPIAYRAHVGILL